MPAPWQNCEWHHKAHISKDAASLQSGHHCVDVCWNLCIYTPLTSAAAAAFLLHGWRAALNSFVVFFFFSFFCFLNTLRRYQHSRKWNCHSSRHHARLLPPTREIIQYVKEEFISFCIPQQEGAPKMAQSQKWMIRPTSLSLSLRATVSDEEGGSVPTRIDCPELTRLLQSGALLDR